MKQIMVLFALLCAAFTCEAVQTECSQDSLRQDIIKRESDETYKKRLDDKKNVMLAEQIADLSALVTKVDSVNSRANVAIAELQKQLAELATLKLLTNRSEEVFTCELPAAGKIPPALQPHFVNITKARELLKMMDGIQKKVATLVATFADDPESSAALVNKSVAASIDKFYSQWSDFSMGGGDATFSTAQKKYLEKHLDIPYNKLIETYFNE